MKKTAIIFSLATIIFSGCKKDPDPVSTVVNVTYPTITLNGPAFVHIPVNGAYTDQGAVLTDDITGATSNISPTETDLDASTPGMYKVLYSAANANGFKTEMIRTILVLDYTPPAGLDPNFDISGEYVRTATGVTLTIAKVDNGLYIVDKVGGSTNVPVYMLTPDTNTIDIPPQKSFDQFDVDCINESYDPGPPITLQWRVMADNFGTGLRSFEKVQ